MAGRPKQFDEEVVLKKAGELFWTKGYEATSTEDLLEVMGIGKGSFYLHFKKGKRELYEKTLQYFAADSLTKLKDQLKNSDDKIEVVKSRFFVRLEDKSFREKGCYVGNTLVEMASLDSDMQKKAAQHLKKLETLFYEVIKEAQEEGHLKTKEDPAYIAKHLINLWNGMNVTRRMGGDEVVLKTVIEKNLEILK